MTTPHRPIVLTLAPREAALITRALDSHTYWQLSDEQYRSDGGVRPPGADDPEARREIRQSEALARRITNTAKGY